MGCADEEHDFEGEQERERLVAWGTLSERRLVATQQSFGSKVGTALLSTLKTETQDGRTGFLQDE